MAEPFNFELILMDFLKYMPEAKRHDYELMLRRCNFSDPADPMFPVMLFLLSYNFCTVLLYTTKSDYFLPDNYMI